MKMNIHSTLLVAWALAGVIVSAVPAAAQPVMLRVAKPHGQLLIESVNPVWFDSVIGTLGIEHGLVEIQAGPVDANGSKHFTLTRVSLRFSNFGVKARKLGETPVPFEHVAMHLRDAIVWPSQENPPPFGMSVYPIVIDPGGALNVTQGPVFVASTKVHDSYFEGDPQIDRRLFLYEARAVETTLGKIDLQHGKLEMRFVFKVPGHILAGDVQITLTMSGDIEGYGENKLPDRPPTEDGSGRPSGKPTAPVIFNFP